jgi:hypothetical protein
VLPGVLLFTAFAGVRLDGPRGAARAFPLLWPIRLNSSQTMPRTDDGRVRKVSGPVL